MDCPSKARFQDAYNLDLLLLGLLFASASLGR